MWVLVLCVLLAGLSACATVTPLSRPSTEPSADASPDSTESEVTLSLPYDRADSLNPYKMTGSTNQALCALLYEGLTAPDDTQHAALLLAESVTADGLTVVATLCESARFSDGSSVSAQDVADSFAAAADSEGYALQLRCVERAEAADSRTVRFTLSEPEPYAAEMLCFPIIRVCADGTVLGSGDYVFSADETLQPNPQKAADSPVVQLRDLSGSEEKAKGLELGTVCYYYNDLSSGTLPRLSSATAAVPLNNLVYLGVNGNRDALKEPAVRQAISLAIDRARLCEEAFAGYATVAQSLFPTAFAVKENAALLPSVSDKTAAMNLLQSLGYITPLPTAEKSDSSREKAKTLSLVLVINADNAFKKAAGERIAAQLTSIGVSVRVEALSKEEYFIAVRHGNYDLYVGEVQLTANFDLSALLSPDGAAAYGLSSSNPTVAAYRAFREGGAVAEFTAVLNEQLPYIPLCWRCGLVGYNRRLTQVSPTAYNVYAGLQNWTSKQ